MSVYELFERLSYMDVPNEHQKVGNVTSMQSLAIFQLQMSNRTSV